MTEQNTEAGQDDKVDEFMRTAALTAPVADTTRLARLTKVTS